MQNKGLLFIPDISGFTQFVNAAEIEHSKMIIQELLENLINSNQLGLEVSEIEGDAILFYKYGESPEFTELTKQVEQMFCSFHKNLLNYSCRRYCQCKACVSSAGLTLKIITHYGEFTGYNVKNFNKLIGKDVIVAHQLLKNEIEQHEYWLVTKNLVDDAPDEFAEWMKWNRAVKVTETGEIIYHYTQLSDLRNRVTLDPVPEPDLSDKTKVISLTREYDTDIITLFHATGDFNYRSRWQDGLKTVKDINHHLPRVGMSCCCVLENGHSAIYSSSYSFETGKKIQFTETETRTQDTINYTIEKTGYRKTKLTIDYHIKKNLINQLIFLMKRQSNLKNTYIKSMQNLEKLIKEIKIPEETLKMFA